MLNLVPTHHNADRPSTDYECSLMWVGILTVSWFGFNSPLRQCIGQYHVVSREKERKKKIGYTISGRVKNDLEYKHRTTQISLLLHAGKPAFAQPYSKLVGRPGTESYPAPPPDPTIPHFLRRYAELQIRGGTGILRIIQRYCFLIS